MNPALLIKLAIVGSMFLVVFALGLKMTPGSVLYLFRHERLLLRSVLAMNIIMLALVIEVGLSVNMPVPIKIALGTLAVSPVPPILPFQQEKSGGSPEYSIGLLAASALLSIVIAPLSILIVDRIKHAGWTVSPMQVAQTVLVSVVVPLVLGYAVRAKAPNLAAKIADPINKFSLALLILAFLPILYLSRHTIWGLVGRGVIIALVMFTVVGLTVGHLLGGPDPHNRRVLALATATRHPGVAMAIAALNFPDQQAAQIVIVYHLILGAIVSFPYVKWQARVNAATRGNATA
jgi:Predicted Na+-dependent transporter